MWMQLSQNNAFSMKALGTYHVRSCPIAPTSQSQAPPPHFSRVCIFHVSPTRQHQRQHKLKENPQSFLPLSMADSQIPADQLYFVMCTAPHLSSIQSLTLFSMVVSFFLIFIYLFIYCCKLLFSVKIYLICNFWEVGISLI